MIDLDNLERLAKAAIARGEEIGEDSWYSKDEYVCNMMMNLADACFCEAVAPEFVLALIAEVRTLREDLQAAKLLAHANAEMFKAEKVDGERYRYLRHIDRHECLAREGHEAGVWIDCEDGEGALVLLTEEDADKAIDAAMAKEPK